MRDKLISLGFNDLLRGRQLDETGIPKVLSDVSVPQDTINKGRVDQIIHRNDYDPFGEVARPGLMWFIAC